MCVRVCVRVRACVRALTYTSVFNASVFIAGGTVFCVGVFVRVLECMQFCECVCSCVCVSVCVDTYISF